MKNIKALLNIAKRNKGNLNTVDKTVCFLHDELIVTDHDQTTTIRVKRPLQWHAIPDGVYFATEIIKLLGKTVRLAECRVENKVGFEVPICSPKKEWMSFNVLTTVVYVQQICDANHYPIFYKPLILNTEHEPVYSLPPTKRISAFRAKNDTRVFLLGYGVTIKDSNVAINATDAHRLIQNNSSGVVNNVIQHNHNHVYNKFLSDVFDEINIELTIESGISKEKEDEDSTYIWTHSDHDIKIVSKVNNSTKYPDVSRVIPDNHTHVFTANSAEIVQALDTVKYSYTNDYNAVELHLANKNVFLKSEYGNAKLNFADWKLDKDFNRKLSFNWTYLKDLCNVCKGDINFYFSEINENASIMCLDNVGDTKIVIMPLRGL